MAGFKKGLRLDAPKRRSIWQFWPGGAAAGASSGPLAALGLFALLAATGPAHAASVIATVPLGAGCNPYGVAVNRRTNLIYVSCPASGTGTTLRVVDGATNLATATIGVGSEPFGLGLNPVTKRLYVANNTSFDVSVVDVDPGSASFHTVIATIPVISAPQGVGVNPLTNRIYVSNVTVGSVSVIDGGTNTVITDVATGAAPDGVAVWPGANRVYVANFSSNTISVIDGLSNSVIDTFAGLISPKHLAFDPLSNRLHATLFATNELKVIDAVSTTTLATVATGSNPEGVALSAFGNRAYVANSGAGSVSVIDTVQNRVLETVLVGSFPRGTDFNPDARRLYVANYGSDTLSVIEDQAECCNLGVTTPFGRTVVTGAGRFELRFNPETGGGIDQLFDLGRDAGRSRDLAGGETAWNSYPTLFLDRLWYPGFPGASKFGWSAGDSLTPDSRVELLEATPTRVKLRQEAFYHHSSLQGATARVPALKGFGDYSVYGTGRLALDWRRRAFGPVTWGGGVMSTSAADLNWIVHRDTTVPALNAWSAFRPIGGPLPPNTTGGVGSGADDFLLMKSNYTATSPNVETDLLATLYIDWAEAQVTEHKDESGVDKAARLFWNDDRAGLGPQVRNWVAGNTEAFRFLTSFRPTNLVDHLDSAVVTRAADYRFPSAITIAQGTRWADANENTGAAADFFNEAEAAYVFDADPPTGLEFDLGGSLASPRYKPFFKVRQWRSLQAASFVTLEGLRLTKGLDYFADVKPVSRAHFVPSLSWHCSIENASSCTPGTGLDIGSAGSAAAVAVFPPGRYGNAGEFTTDGHNVTAGAGGSADFSPVTGGIELWYQPYYNHDDGARHLLWYNLSGALGDFHCLGLEKSAANQLRFVAFVNYSDPACAAPDGNSAFYNVTAAPSAYAWRARDWVHVRTTWNAGGGPKKLRLFVDGLELAFSGVYVPPAMHGQTVFGGCQGICPGGPGNAMGLIDEPHIYAGLDAATGETALAIARGGLLSDPAENLADAGRNFTLALQPVDAAFRGRYLYVGSDAKFHGLNVDLLTPATGASPAGVVWEYWDGTKWASLTFGGTFTDATFSFLQSGKLYRILDPPNWQPISVDGGPDLYYWRAYLIGPPYTGFATERLIKTDILLFQYCGDVTAGAQTFAFPPAADADLGIAKTDGVAGAVPGTFLSYAVSVTNYGPDSVTSLTVLDPLPIALLSPTIVPSTGSFNTVTGQWTGLNMTANDTVILTISGTINPFARGTIVNTATVIPPPGTNDNNAGNDAASDTTTLDPSADIQITKVDDTDPALLGGLVTYTLTVSNGGPSGATGVSVGDVLPIGMDLDTALGAITPSQGTCNYDVPTRTVSCSLGNLAPIAFATVEIKVRPQALGTFTNTASTNRIEPDPVPGNNSASEPTGVQLSSDGVVVLTATSSSGQNVLEWINPTSAQYLRTEIVRRPDRFPTGPGDGFVVYDSGVGGSGGRVKITDNGLANAQTFYYGAFVHRTSAPLVSPGRFVTGRPFDHVAGPVKWAFSTGASAFAAPTVGGAGVIATSNDRLVYAMERGADRDLVGIDSGEWPASFEPIAVGGPVQGRSPVVPISVGGANPVVFAGSQDGKVYAIDATVGGVVPHLWVALLPPVVQAAPAGIFSAFGSALDFVLVGTRDAALSAPNAFVALDPVTGSEIDRYTNGGAGPGAIGIVNGMAAVDYGLPLPPRVYFTSYERTGVGSTITLHCLEMQSVAPVFSLRWGRALGNIDGSPVLRNGRVYVGSPLGGGTVFSIDALDGSNTALDRTFLHGNGQVKGFVFPDRASDDIYFATDDFVWGVTDTGAALMTNKFAGPISLPGGAKPSPVLFVPGDHYVYVGGSDGKLYELDVLGAPGIKSVTLGNGLAVVGAPSLDRVYNLVHVGTEAGIFYAVQVPLP